MTTTMDFPTGFYVPINNVESLDFYAPGGYHPVDIGDLFHNDRYKIIHKLGLGSFCTAWLARDLEAERLVCLKIGMGDKIEARNGSLVQRYPGTAWLDEFYHHGPNGKHLCIVTEAVGLSLSMIDNLERTVVERTIPLDRRQSIGLLVAQELAEMHKNGIVHGDLHASNILLRLPELDKWDDETVYHYFGKPSCIKVHRSDGLPLTEHAPEYVVECSRSALLLALCYRETEICIVDSSDSIACRSGQSINRCLDTVAAHVAPEVFFGDEVTSAVDIWALACLFFWMFSGRQLFDAGHGQNVVMTVRDIALAFGTLPNRWRLLEDLFSSPDWPAERQLLCERWLPRPGESSYGPGPSKYPWDLSGRLERMYPKGDEDWFLLMVNMLRLDPRERISAEEVLKRLPRDWWPVPEEETSEWCPPRSEWQGLGITAPYDRLLNGDQGPPLIYPLDYVGVQPPPYQQHQLLPLPDPALQFPPNDAVFMAAPMRELRHTYHGPSTPVFSPATLSDTESIAYVDEHNQSQHLVHDQSTRVIEGLQRFEGCCECGFPWYQCFCGAQESWDPTL
ncbi:kinase-like domain-containing protein [Sphaerosporella brunnea]|uniref:non-specific serine/threonine protein kinase n=1 Tax=Sphaerosporella brunnea TaxID=1250544 RepID=A0A5J5ELF6_9PEZI|nr:kinase-like domain-containing protein [Sphaerosporella brunnea]